MYSTTTRLSEINIEELLQIAEKAGEAIMKIYQKPFEVIEKQDGSPLTLADKCSNQIINDYLTSRYSIPILSEENENVPYEIRKNWNQLWVIDPLDGTKEFVHKRREFTVNIALVEDGKPILGIIYAPVFRDMFYAVKGQGAFMIYQGKKTQLKSDSTVHFSQRKLINHSNKFLKIMLSFSHNTGFDIRDFVEENSRYPIQFIAMGSSLKFCRVAQGKVDTNIRINPTMEWDTAAAQIILEESGRKLENLENGLPLKYNKENLTNPSFVAY